MSDINEQFEMAMDARLELAIVFEASECMRFIRVAMNCEGMPAPLAFAHPGHLRDFAKTCMDVADGWEKGKGGMIVMDGYKGSVSRDLTKDIVDKEPGF